MRSPWLFALVWLAAVASRVDAADCDSAGADPAGTRRLVSGGVMLAATLSTVAPRVGEPLQVDLALCSPASTAIDRIEVDAHMPAHRHGMNYRPTVTSVSPGRYRASGLLFHMAGVWEIVVTVHRGGRQERVMFSIEAR